jgi:hypothetical protein
MKRRTFVGKVSAVALSSDVAGCSGIIGRENDSPIPLFVTNYDGTSHTVTAIWRDHEGEKGKRTVLIAPENRIRIAEIDPTNSVIVEMSGGFRKGGGPFWDAAATEIYVSGDSAVEILPLKPD